MKEYKSAAPTEEEWNEFWEECFPYELDYDDLGVEVEGEFGGDPIPDGMPMWYPISYSREYTLNGTIDDYTYYLDDIDIEESKELTAKYLNKKVEEITSEDLSNIDKNEMYEWASDYFRGDAREKAWDVAQKARRNT